MTMDEQKDETRSQERDGNGQTMKEQSLEEKYAALQESFRQMWSVVIAYSGGVDSTLLARVAHDVLGERMLAVTAIDSLGVNRELNTAAEFCSRNGIPHQELVRKELDIPGFAENPTNRCYLCKHNLFEGFLRLAKEQGYAYVAEGSNLDDLGDYRPGMRAIRELGVRSPLREAGLTKEEIRTLSRQLGLPTWNKPSTACLASRFVYGERITEEKLSRVGRAEQLLAELGFGQLRVRIHGENLARIEILPEDFDKLQDPALRGEIVRRFREYGFTYVTLDLQGFRSGSMNETLSTR